MPQAPSPRAVAVWARLLRVERDMMEGVERALAEAGLPPLGWYDVLLELARAEGGRLRHRDLHARLLVAKYNLSRLVDRMAAEGLLSREKVAEDGRGAFVAITAAGRALQKRMWPVYAGAIAAQFADILDEDDIEVMSHLLDKLQAGPARAEV